MGNEKIEERNEELHKLRKKTITTVQIVTHMREKLTHIQQENYMMKSELALLEQDLAQKRDLVGMVKKERDESKIENAKYKQQAGIVSSDQLSKDYEDRAERIATMKKDIA